MSIRDDKRWAKARGDKDVGVTVRRPGVFRERPKVDTKAAPVIDKGKELIREVARARGR
jgi:hypothetical protein